MIGRLNGKLLSKNPPQVLVDVGGVDEAVHGGVDRRGGTALAVQAVVEGGDHFVLGVNALVDVLEGAHAVQLEHSQAGFLECAQVSARTLDPNQLDVLAGCRV